MKEIQTIKELTEQKLEAEHLLNISSGIILRLNRAGKITLLNRSGHKILGYKPDELNNKNWFDFCIPKQSRNQVKDVFAQLMQNQVANVEVYENDVLSKDGSIKTILWHNTIIKDDSGKIIGAMSSGEDVTDLRKSEHEVIRILDMSYDLICIACVDGYFKYLNPAWERVLGYTIEELLSKPFLDFIHPEDYNKNDAEVEKLFKGIPTVNFENRYINKDGSVREISWTATPGMDEGLLFCIGRDITEQNRAKEELQNDKNRMNTILNMVGDPIFVKDDKHRFTFANQAFYELLNMNENSMIGYTLAESLSKIEMQHFLKVDRNVLETGITDLREEELTVGKITYTLITRKKRFTDESGNNYLVGSIHDISETKVFEQKLLQEKEYATQLVNSLPGLFYQISPKGRFTNWNDNFKTVSGYSSKEIAEMSPTDLFDGIEKDYIKRRIEEVFIDGYSTAEANFTSKDGTGNPYFFTGTLTQINGNPSLIGMGVDISDRKLSELQLKESEEKFRTVVTNTQGIIYMIDKNGTFTLSEGSGLVKLGLKPGEVVGRSVYDIYKDFPDMLDDMKKTFSGKSIFNEVKVGDTYFRNWYTPSNNKKGETIGLLGLSIDVTEQKVAENKIKQLNNDLENRVRVRTEDLQKTVNLMADREVRMSELKSIVNKLQSQLESAGLKPVATDPLVSRVE